MNLSIPLIITESNGQSRFRYPLTRGAPLPQGVIFEIVGLRMSAPDGANVPAQFRVLSRWPDGSVKWVLIDFQVDLAAGATIVYTMSYNEQHPAPQTALTINLEESDEYIAVDTGPLTFRIGRKRYGLIDQISLRNRESDSEEYTVYDAQENGRKGDAWVGITEGGTSGGTQRQIYGMGGVCRASLASDAYSVCIEESGPLRAVIRCDGACEADIPMHHYAGYRPFRYTTRIYAYAGQAHLRVLHTVVMACNPRETEIDEIALHIPVALNGTVRYALSSTRPMDGTLAPDETIHLAQYADNHFRLYRNRGAEQRVISEGERTEGWLTVDGDEVGVGVALRDMAEEYPCALETSGRGDGLTVYLWRDPDGRRLNLARYAEDVAWHEGEGVYSDGTGTAKTREFFVTFYRSEKRTQAIEQLHGLLNPPHAALDPTWAADCEVTGGFMPRASDRFPASERLMTDFVDWMARCIELGRWYGFLDRGDVLAQWDEVDEDWRFRGRWGWCNSEWDPRHSVWIQYMRTGEVKYFHLGEAMTRHSMDVDTCHHNAIRPYMVGGCFRHSIDHFSDEPCASHTFIDNWVDYYYLTGDLRTYDVLQEAGAFFMRYRWTEDPAYSFSLRSIANVLRGLLHVYEINGDIRVMNRAEEVYEAIARGQNEDGSWHKRFQISTPDNLPDQAPYGMATEGTTLAVEMGSAEPFTDEEFHALGGRFKERIRVLPRDEQKGYQTHYLMLGLELLHRLTGRKDVADVYRRATDWFCGYPNLFDTQFALQEHYGGILCRHVAYAYRLTGDRRYLETGREILRLLVHMQDRSGDPKRHGAIGMSPTYLSLLFFGVPFLLQVFNETEMEEGIDFADGRQVST